MPSQYITKSLQVLYTTLKPSALNLNNSKFQTPTFLTILLSKWRLRVTPSVVQFWFLNGFGFGSWGGSWVPQPMVLHFETKSEPEQAIN